MKLKWFLIKALVTVTLLFAAVFLIKSLARQPSEVAAVIQQRSPHNIIISKQIIMSKLRTKSQIISMEQDIHQKSIKVDDSWLGERDTEINISGTVKMGLNTSDIKIKHIDSSNRLIYIELPKPIIISLDLPYNDITFDKTKGFFRISMSDKDKKEFYISVEKNIRKQILINKDLLKQADLFNQEMIRNMLMMIPDVKGVVFEK